MNHPEKLDQRLTATEGGRRSLFLDLWPGLVWAYAEWVGRQNPSNAPGQILDRLWTDSRLQQTAGRA